VYHHLPYQTQDTSAQLEALKRIEQEMLHRDMRISDLTLRVCDDLLYDLL
jgi:hypothetical protein